MDRDLIVILRDARMDAAAAPFADRQPNFIIEIGKASEAAAHIGIDAVIDPADTREIVLKATASASGTKRSHGQRRNFVDTW